MKSSSLSTLPDEIIPLRAAYQQLSPFWKFFYPYGLKNIFLSGAPLNIAHAAVHHTWFFQRWLFSSLKTFLNSEPLLSMKWLFKSTVFGFISTRQNPLAVAEAMTHFKESTRMKDVDIHRETARLFDPRQPNTATNEAIVVALDDLHLLDEANARAYLQRATTRSEHEATLDIPYGETILTLLQDLQMRKRRDTLTDQQTQREFRKAIQTIDKQQATAANKKKKEDAYERLVIFITDTQLLSTVDYEKKQSYFSRGFTRLFGSEEPKVASQQHQLFKEIVEHPAPQDLLPLLEHVHTMRLLSAVTDRFHRGELLTALIRHTAPQDLRLALQSSPREFETLVLAKSVQDTLDAKDKRLQNIARNSESSMAALLPHEQEGMYKLLAHYQRQGSSSISAVKAALTKRYQAQPAVMVRDNGTKLTLPAEKSAFDRLHLSGTERRKALEHYYQHKTHTALRYLMQPNPWTHNYAALSPTQLKNIALFWQAVSDETTPAVGGYTLEGRIDAFIMGLADLGRAHNWDRSRINPKTRKEEQYDDLQPDRPTCGMGVDTRLYRTIQGHPLTQDGLTFEILNQEIHDFVKAHFLNTIELLDREAKSDFYEQLVEYVGDPAGASSELKESIETLNVDDRQQEALMTLMQQKYKTNLTDHFKAHIRKQFALTDHFPSHFLRFQQETHIMDVFNTNPSATPHA